VVLRDTNGLTLLLPPSQEKNMQDAPDHIPTLVSRMWHFPTVSVTGNPAQQLRRFLRDFLPVAKHAKFQLEPLGKVRHSVTYRAISIAPFLVNFKQLPRVPNAKRVPLREISSLPVSNLTRKVDKPRFENYRRGFVVDGGRDHCRVALNSSSLLKIASATSS